MRPLLNTALVVSLLCASSVAQSAQPSLPNSRKVPRQKPVPGRQITPQKEQAISILNDLFVKTIEFADDKTRINTQAQIADALWEYDQQNARRQFTESFLSIERIEDEERSFPLFDSPKSFLRIGLLRLIAKRDADLAERLIKDVLKTPTKNDQSLPIKKQSVRGNLYLNLANELIPTDPRRAADLIPKGFNSGFGTELIGALKFLGREESEVADKLLRQALSEIQPNPERPMMDLFIIGQYFIPDYKDPASHNNNEWNDDSSNPSQPIKPGLVEPLLNFAFKAVTIESANEQKRMSDAKKQKRMVMFDLIDQGTVAWLLPLFEKHQPERAAFIRSYLGQIEDAIPTPVRQAMNTHQPTTVKELLDEAQTKKKHFDKDLLYAEAARKAKSAGDFDQAIAITEKLSDKSMGMDVSSILNSATINAIDKGDVDAAYRYAKEISDPFDRAKALCKIALKSFEKRDLQRDYELINEAENLIAMSGSASEKVFPLLNVAAVVTAINPARGFEAVNTAIEAINQIYSATSERGRMGFILDSATFDNSLGVLARTDFQRALRLALAITESEVSALAQLAVCRGALVESNEQREESGGEEKKPGRKSARPKVGKSS